MAKLRISGRNTKEKLVFLFIHEREELRQSPRYDCNKPGIFELETVRLTVFIPKKMIFVLYFDRLIVPTNYVRRHSRSRKLKIVLVFFSLIRTFAHRMNTIFIVLPILVLLMFDLGLTLRPADFRLVVERPRAILVGLAGQILLLPLIGLAIGFGFQLEAVFFLGVMLIACSPGGSSSNVFSMLAGGDVALSVSLTMLSSIITLFTGPLVMSYATGLVGENQSITLPVGNLLVQNIVLMLVPIVIGLSVAMWREQLARKMHSVLKKLAFPALILLASIFFIQNRETIVREFPQLGLAMTVLILLAMGGGVALSWMMRLSGREQRTIIIEIGMQNAAQAISIASSPFVFANDVMAIPAIVYALMMNVILLAYVGIIKSLRKN